MTTPRGESKGDLGPARRVVIAVVRDDDATERAIGRAIELGLAGARVILYDVGAKASIFENPLPTAFSSQDLDRKVPPALTPDQLDTVGQAGLGRRVRALIDAGIDAYGWLPDDDQAGSLARYADGMGARTVIATEGLSPDAEALRNAGIADVESLPAQTA